MDRSRKNGGNPCMLVLQVLGLATVLITLILVSVLLNRELTGVGNSGVTNSQATSSSNPAYGPDRPCEWTQELTLNGDANRKTIQRYPKPRGTACSDECVTEGTCSGDDYMDNGPDGSNDMRPFCNATDFSKCKGTCSVWQDCPIPSFIYGADNFLITMCYGGGCLTQTVLYFSGIPSTPITPLVPTFTYDGYNAMGPESAICRYSLLDNVPEFPTTKRCLDTYYISVLSPSMLICGYTHKCNRPNFLGIGSDGGISITNIGSETTRISRYNSDGTVNISVHPAIESFFEGVNSTETLRNATKHLVEYATTHREIIDSLKVPPSVPEPPAKRSVEQKISFQEIRMGIKTKTEKKEQVDKTNDDTNNDDEDTTTEHKSHDDDTVTKTHDEKKEVKTHDDKKEKGITKIEDKVHKVHKEDRDTKHDQNDKHEEVKTTKPKFVQKNIKNKLNN